MGRVVDREGLQHRLTELWRQGGQMAWICGEAGAGKTTLVRTFTESVAEPVLVGACERLATPAPLGPFLDLQGQVEGAAAEGISTGRHPRDIAVAVIGELQRPSVLVLEDMHWADEASLDVLRIVARRIAGTPSLVLATYREDEVVGDHPLRRLLGDLSSHEWVESLSVPSLSLAAVEELAAGATADAEAIHAVTGGNAFFVTELLATPGAALPATVRDAVLARVSLLSDPARELLSGASLVPGRVEISLLSAAFPAVAERVDECVAAGVLETSSDFVAFRHELARLSVESLLAPHRRRSLHAEILRALEHLGADSSRLAHHADAAGDVDALLRHGRAAAEQGAATGAHRESAAQYARVLSRAAGLASADVRAELLEAYALEAQAGGGYAVAVEALTEAIGIQRNLGDPLRSGAGLAKSTRPLVVLGRNVEADRASREAVELLESLPTATPELAAAYAARAYLQMIRRDNRDAADSARQSVSLAQRFDEPDTLAFGLNMLGTARIMAGDIEEGTADVEQSIVVGRRHGLEQRVAHSLWMLGSGLGEMYELERAESALQAHIDYAGLHDLDSAYTRAWLAAVQVYRGQWDIGAATAQGVLDRAEEVPVVRITADVALGRVRARRGDADARLVLDEALHLARPGGHLQRLGHVHAARAESCWIAGDRAGVLLEAAAVYPLAIEKRHVWFAGELAYWQWKAGAKPDAPDWIAEPYRLQLDGRPAEAAERWYAHGAPYEAARALIESDDVRDVTAGLTELDRLGAGPAVKVARERLVELGAPLPRGRRPATRANPGGLTVREIEVLRLVADGLTNADVARELVLSPRTVDHHVSAVLRKLDAKSRGAAVARATRDGFLDRG